MCVNVQLARNVNQSSRAAAAKLRWKLGALLDFGG